MKTVKEFVSKDSVEIEVFGTFIASAAITGYAHKANVSGLSFFNSLQIDLSSTIERVFDVAANDPSRFTVGVLTVGLLSGLFGMAATYATKENIKRNTLIQEWSKRLEEKKIAFKDNQMFTASSYPKANFMLAKVNCALSGVFFATQDFTDDQFVSKVLFFGGGAALVNSVKECVRGNQNLNRLRSLAKG